MFKPSRNSYGNYGFHEVANHIYTCFSRSSGISLGGCSLTNTLLDLRLVSYSSRRNRVITRLGIRLLNIYRASDVFPS